MVNRRGMSGAPRRTVGSKLEIDDGPDPDVDDTQKALVLLLEFLLVEDLYDQDALFGDLPVTRSAPTATPQPLRPRLPHMSKLSFQ